MNKSECRRCSGTHVQLNSCSGVQVVSTHGQTAKDDVALVNHRHVAAGGLHLRTDGLNATGCFLLAPDRGSRAAGRAAGGRDRKYVCGGRLGFRRASPGSCGRGQTAAFREAHPCADCRPDSARRPGPCRPLMGGGSIECLVDRAFDRHFPRAPACVSRVNGWDRHHWDSRTRTCLSADTVTPHGAIDGDERESLRGHALCHGQGGSGIVGS